MPKDSDFSGSEFWGLWLRVISPPSFPLSEPMGAQQLSNNHSIQCPRRRVMCWTRIDGVYPVTELSCLLPGRIRPEQAKLGQLPKSLKFFFCLITIKFYPNTKPAWNSISPQPPPLLFPWLILWYVNLTGTWSTLDSFDQTLFWMHLQRMVLDEIYI